MMEPPTADQLARDLDGTFPAFVRAHQDLVYSAALQLTRDHHDAEDVTQETFVRAYRALADRDAPEILELRIRPWLWTIAVNLCRNRHRSRSRRPRETVLEEDPATATGPEATVVDADVTEWRERLARLTGPQRTAIVLRHVVGLSYEEIAEASGRPVGTVKSDVHRGLARLRSQMGGNP